MKDAEEAAKRTGGEVWQKCLAARAAETWNLSEAGSVKDPRLVEIEFLSALEKAPSDTVTPWDWAARLDVSKEFFQAMVIGLFSDRCLDGHSSIHLASASSSLDPSEWALLPVHNSAVQLANWQTFPVYINHAGRLRLWRLRDEILKARTKDPFDLLWDKRHWNTDLTMHLAMRDAGASTVVIFMDVDDFKAVNEKAGHVVGDEILRIIFQTVLELVGSLGDAYRWGGDEIAVLLPNTSLGAGSKLGEVIRDAVEQQCSAHFKLRAAKLKTTVSVGVGAVKSSASADAVTAGVDDLTLRVKKNGKNKVLAETLAF